jgi:hypothetical protein
MYISYQLTKLGPRINFSRTVMWLRGSVRVMFVHSIYSKKAYQIKYLCSIDIFVYVGQIDRASLTLTACSIFDTLFSTHQSPLMMFFSTITAMESINYSVVLITNQLLPERPLCLFWFTVHTIWLCN